MGALKVRFLEEFVDRDFAPSEGGGAQRPGIDTLPDGSYQFEVNKSLCKINEAKAMLILEVEVEVLTSGQKQGQVVQHAWFVKDKDSADRCGGDLKRLGFDVANWTVANGRPFSQEIQKVPGALKGLRFSAEKTSSKGNSRTFHNLNKITRLPNDGKPPTIGPELLDAADPDDPFPDDQ